MWCQVSSLDHRLAFPTKTPGKQRLSDPKSPRQGHRHRLSQSVTNGTVFTIGVFHQEGSPSPHKVSLLLHTKSEGHMTSTQDACRSKASLKGALARTNPYRTSILLLGAINEQPYKAKQQVQLRTIHQYKEKKLKKNILKDKARCYGYKSARNAKNGTRVEKIQQPK